MVVVIDPAAGNDRRTGHRIDRSDRSDPGRAPDPAVSTPSARRRPRHAIGPPGRTRRLRRRARRTARCRIRVFGAVGASHCLQQDIWRRGGDVRDRSVAAHRAMANGLVGQIWRPATTAGARDHAARGDHQILFSRSAPACAPVVLADGGRPRELPARGATRPYVRRRRVGLQSLAKHAQHDIVQSSLCSRSVLEPDLLARVMDESATRIPGSTTSSGYGSSTRSRRDEPRRAGVEHLADCSHRSICGVPPRSCAHRARIAGRRRRQDSTRSVTRSNG